MANPDDIFGFRIDNRDIQASATIIQSLRYDAAIQRSIQSVQVGGYFRVNILSFKCTQQTCDFTERLTSDAGVDIDNQNVLFARDAEFGSFAVTLARVDVDGEAVGATAVLDPALRQLLTQLQALAIRIGRCRRSLVGIHFAQVSHYSDKKTCTTLKPGTFRKTLRVWAWTTC